MGYMWAIYYLYLITTSVSGRVPGYPSYYPAGTRVINYPDTAALNISEVIGWEGWVFCTHQEIGWKDRLRNVR